MCSDRLRILALEPYYGGSHKAVLDGLVEHVDAEWTLVTHPARKWKWRMRGAALTMAAEVARLASVSPHERPWDVLFCSTFLNLAEFKGLSERSIASLPSIVYFHENQIVYPNRHTAEWDLQFPLTNITTALSATRCIFNTRWNLDGFLDGIPPFLRQFPDQLPVGVAERIAEKSGVLAPPFDSAEFDSAELTRGRTARIVWPHRWEHDKNPDDFFAALRTLVDADLDFEVAVAGQPFRETADAFTQASSFLGPRLVHSGMPESKAEYARLLASSDVAVSTAHNEFFGLAMMEASYCGCYPVVPDRLAYPELYDERFRYRSVDELAAMLASLVRTRPRPGAHLDAARGFTFERMTPAYESMFREVAGV